MRCSWDWDDFGTESGKRLTSVNGINAATENVSNSKYLKKKKERK